MPEPMKVFDGITAEVGVSPANWLQAADVVLTQVTSIRSAAHVVHDLLIEYPGSQVVVGRHPLDCWWVVQTRGHDALLVLPVAGAVRPSLVFALAQLFRFVDVSDSRSRS